MIESDTELVLRDLHPTPSWSEDVAEIKRTVLLLHCEILVVDDDEDVCESLKQMLEQRYHRVATAGSVKDALELCATVPFDIVILDIKLADASGVDLIAQLAEILPDAEVLVVTGHANLESAMSAVHPAAVGYLTKPVDVERVLAIVGRITDRKRLAYQAERLQQQIRRAKEEWETTFDAITDPIAIADAAGAILRANSGFCKIFGIAHQELVGELDRQIIFGSTAEEEVPAGRQAALAGQSFQVEVDNLAVPGTFAISCSPVELRGARGVIYVLCDMTQRKGAEQLKAAQEERMRTILDSTADGIITIDEQGIVQSANRAVERIFGYRTEEVVGQNLKMLMPAPYQEEHDGYLERYHSTGEAHILNREREVEGRRKDGTTFPLAIRVREMPINGAPQYIGSLQDISERKRAERDLRVEQARLEELFQASPEAVILVCNEGRILRANRYFTSLFGYQVDEVVGQVVEDILAPEELLEEARSLTARVSAGERVEVETVRCRKDGSTIPVSIVGAPIDIAGEQVGVYVMYRDITERKRAERKVRQSRDKLRSLVARVEAIREEERTAVARQVHDELGQALTGLKFDLRWLRNHLPKNDKPVHQRLEEMIQLLDATSDGVRQLAARLRPAVLDDFGLVDAVEWQVRDFGERTEITCAVVKPSGNLDLSSERATVLFRILQEALTNVARHANASRVAVSLGVKGGDVVLEVRDDGKGITGQEVRNITSLGLVGMRERAAALGGQVNIQCQAESGTVVTATIPQCP